MNVDYKIGADLGQTKRELSEYKNALERRDEFIRWLVEVKHEGDDSLCDLWDEFEKYESGDCLECENNSEEDELI